MTTTELRDLLTYARDHQLGVSTLAALNHLHAHGRAKTSTLAGVLGVTTASVTGFADRLIAMGLITRAHSTSDRRIIYLKITPQGTRLITSALLGPALV